MLKEKWVGDAWHQTNKEMVVRSFKKCGISLALDGSEDDLVNIEKVPGYTMPPIEDSESYEFLSDEDESSGSDNDYVLNENIDSDDDKEYPEESTEDSIDE